MKPSKYTLMIIPDGEGKQWAATLSRTIFFIFVWGLTILIAGSAVVLVTAFPKIKDYNNLEHQYDTLLSEREAILELASDVDKIRQMENVVREGLGLETNAVSDDSISMEDIIWIQMESDHMPVVLPVKGIVTQGLVLDENHGDQNHLGIDIAVKEGNPVAAASAGQVVYSGWSEEFGNLVIIYHGDGYITYYGHNSENLVKSGALVKAGEKIAHSGNTGLSSGPHLHFEVWKDKEPVNPLLFFPEYREGSVIGDENGQG